MKKLALAAALALGVGSGAQAAVVEIVQQKDITTVPAHASAVRGSDIAAVRAPQVVQLAATDSELPEPEVFLMMVVGLVLIGYRVGRDSSDKFE